MFSTRVVFTIVGMCWLSACGASSTAAQSPTPAQSDQTPATAPTHHVAGHCSEHEAAVFSCTIKGANKVVSLCLADNKTAPNASLRYAFGAPGKPEMTFPSLQSPPMRGGFKRAHLMFAGNTGGYAYSFINGNTKYILYSISGANGLADSGVLVTPADSRRVAAALACDNGTLTEAEFNKVENLDRLLERDEDLESRGLPAKE
jgi:hypothetical protein